MTGNSVVVSPHVYPTTVIPPHFRELAWLRSGVSTRWLVPPGTPLASSVRLLQRALHLEHMPFAFCRQQHTANVCRVDAAHLREGMTEFIVDQCDGLIATCPGIALAVFTADCVPILFADPYSRIIGALHAGWRGTLSEIARKAMDQLNAQGVRLDKLQVWIGPAIGGCCYEVSEDLAATFAQKFAYLVNGSAGFLTGRFLNLVELNRLQLLAAGVVPEHVCVSGLCTKHSLDIFYSYRAEGKRAGRIVSIIARVD